MTSPTLAPPCSTATTPLTSRFGSFDRRFWVVVGGTAVNRLGNMVVPFLVFFLASRGVATSSIPYVLGALGAGGLLGPVLGGLLADRAGSRPGLVGGMLSTAAAQGLLYAAPNLVTLVGAAALLGAVGSIHQPAASAVIAGSVGQADRRIGFATLHWAVNVGTAVAGALGGYLAVHGYGLLFALDAATCLGYAALAAALLPRGPVRAAVEQPGDGGAGYRVVLRDRLMLTFVALTVMADLVYAQTEFTLPLAIRDHGLPAGAYGLAAMVNAVIVVGLQPFASVWSSRFDRVRVWALASALITAGVALTGLARTTWQFALTVVVWSLGEACVGGILTSLVADLAPGGAQGRYQGALGWARGLARFAALGGGAAVYAALGPAVLWWGCALGGLAAATTALLLTRRVAARTGPGA